MPEFVMPLADKAQINSFAQLDEFTQGYVEALFFTECHGDNPELEEKTIVRCAPARQASPPTGLKLSGTQREPYPHE